MSSILLSLVVPAIGSVLSCYLGFSGVPDFIRARRTGVLHIDPTPFPFGFAAAFSWVIYGVVTNDPWPIIANASNVIFNFFCIISAVQLCKDEAILHRMEFLAIVAMVVLVLVLILTGSPVLIVDSAIRTKVASWVCFAITVAYFYSPCLEAISAIRKRDTSSLCLPLLMAGLVCTSFWVIYGLAFGLVAIWLPNGIGATLMAFSTIVKLSLRNRVSVGRKHYSPREALNEALHEGHSFSLRPLCSATGENLIQVHETSLTDEQGQDCQSPPSSPWKVERVDSEHVAFSVGENLYLQVQRRESMPSSSSDILPTGHVAIPVQCLEPGEAGKFLPVDGPKKSISPLGDIHEYPHESICFWNPLHRVFIRVNELGTTDCSAVCKPADGENLQVPVGWVWERFTVQLSHGNGLEGLRQRR